MNSIFWHFFLCLIINNLLVICKLLKAHSNNEEMPYFEEIIPNITVASGRNLTLPCIVNKLGNYRVAWLRVEDKGILTIHNNIITRNYRVSLSTNEDRKFALNIRNVQESDRGGYMCQVNTIPMRSQVGYVQVVVPPDIVVEESSSDVITTEGSNVTLKCKAKGYPTPSIKWKKEDQTAILLQNGQQLSQQNKYIAFNKTGETLDIYRVTRVHMGAYLCIASNGVPPSVSRRILLHVHFSPTLWIPHQTLNAHLHNEISLDCHVEAYPPASVFWLNSRNELITEHSFTGNKLKIELKEKQYKTHLRLTIRNLNQHDFGVYKCLARNTLGEQQAVINLQESNSYKINEDQNQISVLEELSNDLVIQNSDTPRFSEINDIQLNAQHSKKLNEKIYPVFVKIQPKKSFSISKHKKTYYEVIFIIFLNNIILFNINTFLQS